MLVTMLLSHASDGATGATWLRRNVGVESSWQQYYRVMLVMALSGRLGRDAM
jgi:hypothetical protein